MYTDAEEDILNKSQYGQVKKFRLLKIFLYAVLILSIGAIILIIT